MSKLKNRYLRKYDSLGNLLYSKNESFDTHGNIEVEEIYDDNLFEDNQISRIYKGNKLVKEVFLNSDTFIEYSSNSQIAIKIAKTTNNYLYDSTMIEEQKKKLSSHSALFSFSNLFKYYLENYVIKQINFQLHNENFKLLELDILDVDTSETETHTKKYEYQIDNKLILEESYTSSYFGSSNRTEYKYIGDVIISSHYEDGYHLFDSIDRTIKGEQRNFKFEAKISFSFNGENYTLRNIEITKDYKSSVTKSCYNLSNEVLKNEQLLFSLSEISELNFEYIKGILPTFKLVYNSNINLNSNKNVSSKEIIDCENDATENSTFNYIYDEHRKLLSQCEFSSKTNSTKNKIEISIITIEYY